MAALSSARVSPQELKKAQAEADRVGLAVFLNAAPVPAGKQYTMMSGITERPNERRGVDAGWRVLFALQRCWPRATQGERWAEMAELGRTHENAD